MDNSEIVSESEIGQQFGSMHSRDRFSPSVLSVQPERRPDCTLSILDQVATEVHVPICSATKAVHLVVFRVILPFSRFAFDGCVAWQTEIALLTENFERHPP